MKKHKFFKKFPILLALCVFALSLVYSTYAVLQSFDFVKEIYLYTGLFALVFLNVSLFFSLFHFKFSPKFPLYFGLFSVFYALLHFLNYFVFEKNMSLARFLSDISSRLFEASGFVAFFLLLLMFLSSFNFFKKLSFIRKFAYLCLLIASYHFFLSAKSPNLWEFLALFVALLWCGIKIYKICRKKLTKKVAKN